MPPACAFSSSWSPGTPGGSLGLGPPGLARPVPLRLYRDRVAVDGWDARILALQASWDRQCAPASLHRRLLLPRLTLQHSLGRSASRSGGAGLHAGFPVHAEASNVLTHCCNHLCNRCTHPPTGPSSWVPSTGSSPCAACRASKRVQMRSNSSSCRLAANASSVSCLQSPDYY